MCVCELRAPPGRRHQLRAGCPPPARPSAEGSEQRAGGAGPRRPRVGPGECPGRGRAGGRGAAAGPGVGRGTPRGRGRGRGGVPAGRFPRCKWLFVVLRPPRGRGGQRGAGAAAPLPLSLPPNPPHPVAPVPLVKFAGKVERKVLGGGGGSAPPPPPSSVLDHAADGTGSAVTK